MVDKLESFYEPTEALGQGSYGKVYKAIKKSNSA